MQVERERELSKGKLIHVDPAAAAAPAVGVS